MAHEPFLRDDVFEVESRTFSANKSPETLEKSMAPYQASTSMTCSRVADMGKEARAIGQDHLAPAHFLNELLDKKLLRDAVLFLAHALPEREALWWACRTIREQAGPGLERHVASAIFAAERWTSDPSEMHRLAAYPTAEAAGFGTPPGCLAFTVWSESDTAPDELPGNPPKGQRTAPLVAKTILLAAVTAEDGELIKDPARMIQRLEKFLRIGVEVANGTDRWPDPRGGTAHESGSTRS